MTATGDLSVAITIRIQKLKGLQDSMLFWPFGAACMAAVHFGGKMFFEGTTFESVQREPSTLLVGVIFVVAGLAHLITRNIVGAMILLAEIEQTRVTLELHAESARGHASAR